MIGSAEGVGLARWSNNTPRSACSSDSIRRLLQGVIFQIYIVNKYVVLECARIPLLLCVYNRHVVANDRLVR